MTQPVELVYQNKLFKLNLTPYEIQKCQNDPAFYEELGAKYYQMYQQGHVSAKHVANDIDLENIAEINELIESGPTQTLPSNDDYEKFIWPRPAVLILLTELEQRKTQLMQPHKKRVLFGEIASILQKHDYKVSCERKWRGMQATYKKTVNKQNKSGTNAIRWEFFDRVSNIIQNDPAYNPLATVSIGVANVATVNAEAVVTNTNNISTSNTKGNKNKDSNEIFNKFNDELKEMRSAMNDCNEIQRKRNNILTRIAAALENLYDQQC